MSTPEPLHGRLHPLGIVVLAWQWVRYAVLGGLVSGIARGDLTVILPIVALGAAIATPFAFLAWKRFRYRVDDDRLIVERGVVVEQERVVPLHRIRGVDISAPLLHRILGLVQVSVDAAGAGGGASELTLAAVSRAQAEELRHRVLHRDAGSPEEVARRESPVVARVSYRTLALAGATSTRWLLAPLIALGALANVVVRDESTVQRVGETVVDALPRNAGGQLAIGLGVVLAAVAVAALGSMIVDGGFRLSRRGDRLTAERGLLRRRSVSLDRARVSALEFYDTPMWRAVGLVGLRALVAGVGGGEGEARGRTSLLPAGRPRAAWRLARSIDRRVAPDVEPHPPAARARRLFRAVAIPGGAALIALAAGEWAIAIVLAVATGAMVPVGLDRYRALGHAFVNGRIAMRSGSLSRRHTLINPATVASYHVSSTPFQRRAGVCTLSAHLGRGAPARSAVDLSGAQAASLLLAAEPALMGEFVESGGGDVPAHPDVRD